MFTVEIKINGSLIGHNAGVADRGRDAYRYEFYEVESRKIVNGGVLHRRADGINKLVGIILDDADEKKKGEKK